MFGLAVLLFASSCEKKIEQPDPTLTLSQTEVNVPAEGGTFSVAYKITDPREGDKLTVEAVTNDWVTNFEEVDNNINFDVAANDVMEQRSVDVTVSYPGVSDQVFTIVQSAKVADYDYVFTEAYVTFYESMGNNGEDNYYMVLSDMPVVGGIQYGSTNYYLDLYVEPGSTSGRELPVGTYDLGDDTSPMTAGSEYTYFLKLSDTGETEAELYFTDGSVNVAFDGETYTIEGLFTDTEGMLHHFVYTGSVFAELPENIEFEASFAGAVYAAGEEDVMEVLLQFTDMTPDEEGMLYAPGTLLTLDAYLPYDAEGGIAAGTYEVAETGAPFTLYPGDEIMAMFGLGSSVAYAPAETFTNYYITSGTVDVSGSAESGYTFNCNLVTAEGVPVKCTYVGSLDISGMPGPVSTLTGDHELALDGATGIAYYYGDYYGVGGGNWMFAIDDQLSGGDGVQVDLVVDGLNFEDGIPTGTYTASAEPYPGEFVEGYIQSNYLMGTWYTLSNASGSLIGYAPAMEGTIDIVNNGDGSYEMTFDCTDDLGYVWSGSWSGTLNASDESGSLYSTKSVSSAKQYKKTSVARGAQTLEEKAEIIESSSFKLGTIQVQKREFGIGR